MGRTQGDWINLGYRVDVDIADGLSGICEMSDWMDKEEMESNAKLIAAAPEMLEALKSARREMLKTGVNYDNANAYNMIDKAIKKATE